MLIGLDVGCLRGCEVDGDGAQLQSAAAWVRLKQCLHLETFAWPTKAMFHNVGSILAQVASGDAAAFCLNRRS